MIVDCARARQFWHDRHDGSVAPTDADNLAAHLRSCPSCAQYHRDMDALSVALDELRVQTAAVGRETPLAGALRRTKRASAFAGLTLGRVARVAAALALVAGAGLYYSRRPQTLDGPVTPSLTPARLESAVGVVAPLERPRPAVQVQLTGASAAEFMAVERPSSQPGVHVVWLYRAAGSARSGG